MTITNLPQVRRLRRYPANDRGKLDKIVAWVRGIPARITNVSAKGQFIPRIHPFVHLGWASFFYLGGLATSWNGAVHGNCPLLAFGWAMTIHGSRKLQLNIAHACAHGTVSGNEVVDDVIGRATLFAVLGTEFRIYKPNHNTLHHNWGVLATDRDPTAQSLAKAGIVPGVPKNYLYRRLGYACISPVFHTQIFAERIASHVKNAGLYRAFFIASGLTLIVSLTLLNMWPVFLLSVSIPLVWGYQTSQLLRLCVEHRVPENPQTPRPSSEMQELTDGICLRLSSPVDMLVRLLVLTGDSVAHHFHHYQPRSHEWANYVTASQKAKEESIANGRPNQYHEFTGYLTALDACFEALSRAPRGEND